MTRVICLIHNGSEVEIEMKIGYCDAFNEKNILDKIKIEKGFGKIEKVYEYYVKGKTISVFAYIDGKVGLENKHELPCPIENDIFFGNIYFIANIHNIALDFTMKEYKNFKKTFLGENVDLGSIDSWSLVESVSSDDSIHDFVVDDDVFDEIGDSNDSMNDE